MKAVDGFNLLGIALALVAAIWGGSMGTGRGMRRVDYYPRLRSDVAPKTLDDGTRVLVDAGGHALPLVRYERILSGSLIADRVLDDLCERARIVGFTPFFSSGTPTGYRYRDKPRVDARATAEQVLALKPDLLIVNNVVDPGRVERLREHGVHVFDLGHMRGISSLLSNIRAIGYLIDAPDRAERYAERLAARLERIAPRHDPQGRPSAIYLNSYADKLYGGAAHTSYHDVLEYAGLRDAAAEAGIDGWPQLTAERVLALNPDYLVTRTGMGEVLCGLDALSALRACAKGAVVEVDGVLLDDPGPAMLDAAEALHEALERVRRSAPNGAQPVLD